MNPETMSGHLVAIVCYPFFQVILIAPPRHTLRVAFHLHNRLQREDGGSVGFEEYERRNIFDDHDKMKDEMCSMRLDGSCGVSSAACTSVGMGSGTCANAPFGP